MKYDEFIATVRDRGEYVSIQEADEVTRAVLHRLGERLGRHAPHLAAQLPKELQGAIPNDPGPARSYGLHDQILSQLPAGYAPLFGKPELA
jgi:uncharacterized protein (DUF2267 family)